MSMSGKTKRQTALDDEFIPLSNLMEQDSLLENEYEVIESAKPKRKRKPKPQPAFQIPNSVVIAVAALLIGFVGATMIAFVAPSGLPQPPMVPQPIEQAVPIQSNPDVPQPNSLVDRWLLLNQDTYQIPANTFVRVLSQDNSPEFYNVVDLDGRLAIVRAEDLSEAANAPLESVYPPLGPFSDALGKNQKLLVTVEWNGDMPPGTLVYAMGWRVEDGSWIYEVSPDRVKIYYLPDLHLTWSDSVNSPGS